MLTVFNCSIPTQNARLWRFTTTQTPHPHHHPFFLIHFLQTRPKFLQSSAIPYTEFNLMSFTIETLDDLSARCTKIKPRTHVCLCYVLQMVCISFCIQFTSDKPQKNKLHPLCCKLVFSLSHHIHQCGSTEKKGSRHINTCSAPLEKRWIITCFTYTSGLSPLRFNCSFRNNPWIMHKISDW